MCKFFVVTILLYLSFFQIINTSFSAPIPDKNEEIVEENVDKPLQETEEEIATSELKNACLKKLEVIERKLKEGSASLAKVRGLMATFLNDIRANFVLIQDQMKKTVADAKEKLKKLLEDS